MPNYRRLRINGGTYFFTVVTHNRNPWLCHPDARNALRQGIQTVRVKRPFRIDAWVLLPDHLHCIWTLPDHDADFAVRWRLIKLMVTRQCVRFIESTAVNNHTSHRKRKERLLWQRRFWEHRIRDEADFNAHCDYIHYNAVKHGLSQSPADWPYSTFHRFVANGVYPRDWGKNVAPIVSSDIGGE